MDAKQRRRIQRVVQRVLDGLAEALDQAARTCEENPKKAAEELRECARQLKQRDYLQSLT